jgi:hypothetical protein
MERSCEFQWFGQTWKCLRGAVSGDDGGECDTAARTITVNESFDNEDFLNTLHHELFEGASYMTGCTYTKDFPDEQDLFVMTHTQMDIISSGIRGAYEEIKRMMLAKGKSKGPAPKSKSVKKCRHR